MDKKFLIALGLMACSVLNINSVLAKEPKGDLVSFRLELGSAMSEGGYQYEAELQNDELLVNMYYYTSNGIVKKRRAVNGDAEFLKGLDNVIKEQKLYTWDGFHKEDSNVLDGEGFGFRAEYKNGNDERIIRASGSNVFPADYEKGSKAVANYFMENVDKMPTVKEEYTFAEVKQEVMEALKYMAEQGIISNNAGGEVFAFSAKGDIDLAMIVVDIAMDPGHSFQLLVRNNKPIALKVVAADGKNIEPVCAAVDDTGKLSPYSTGTYDERFSRKEF